MFRFAYKSPFTSLLLRSIRFSAILACILFGLRPAVAQSELENSSLEGRVLDASGGAIKAANVVVRNETTGAVRSATTGDDGRFSINDLPAGMYTVEASASGFAVNRHSALKVAAGETQDASLTLSVSSLSQEVTVTADSDSIAAQLAPSQTPLDTHSAKSEIGEAFIRNFIPPTSDFTEVLNMAPGTFSVNPNGIGLGDSKIYFRGFQDGQFTMTFDGIPFNDTNTPSHHSWAFFPSQWIGRTDFDRSPGLASTIGPTNFGGSINLMSRDPLPYQDARGTFSYSSFNTRLIEGDYDSGPFGSERRSSILLDVHQMNSDGYQTFNYQKRDAGSIKYQYRVSDKTTITLFAGVIDLATNTPNTKGPTRAQVAQFGDNFLLSGDPTSPNYYRFNFYHVTTDFEYGDVKSDLGGGWTFDNKPYSYQYYNKQNYNGTTITATSATDKLNSYRKYGDALNLSQESRLGIFRVGVWYEWAHTDRFQIPSDPRTWADALLPNFHETFITQSAQPFAEYQFNVTRRLSLTAGIKLAHYSMDLDQFPDNGKIVGCLGGALTGATSAPSTVCAGGPSFVAHSASYNSWMPAADARYRLKENWSLYAQFATGSVIPPSSVFDVKNAAVAVLPNPTTTKTYQAGSVLKMKRWTLDVDGYYSHFQNPYVTTPDPTTGEPVYYLTGPSNTKGVEAESNIFVMRGLSLYLNGTAGSAKYAKSGLWVASAPRNTGTVGVTYQHQNWDVGFFNKRIGRMYNDNGATNQAVAIDPFNLSNLFFNYTIKSGSHLNGTKLQFGINNLLDRHSIVGITPASTTTSVAAPGDVLTLLPARSFSMSITFGYAPNR